ncbi:MAG: hypothetical protein HY699_18980 [Deltaproteobacteria bacterium]|nr:hypothetical protein [Deltaproteobacteria bacterium]
MAAVLTLAANGSAAAAAPLIIDDFSSAVNTILVANTNVGVFVPGTSVTVTDSGLADVLGGTRELTVRVEHSPGFIIGLDNVVVGVVPLASFLDYNSTAGADGQAVLRYDRGGLGLNVGLTPAAGIRLVTIDADFAAVPCQIIVTLVDTAGHSASLSRTVALAGITPELNFPFTGFPGVDVRRISSIAVEIDPNRNGAADLRLDRLETYGSRPVAAPLVSPPMLAVLALVLLLCGLRRLAWA